jgi:diguanylate cyclase (GGDEF)-like protein
MATASGIKARSLTDRASAAVRTLQGRTKIHHVYYLLAAFDVIAVIAGLLLTHHAVDRLTLTVRSNLEWSAIHDQVGALRAVAGRVNAPGNDVFESQSAGNELKRVELAALEFEPALASVKRSVREKIRDDVEFAKAQLVVLEVETAMIEMVTVTRSLLQHYAQGESAIAGAGMAVMDRKYNAVLAGIDRAGRVLRGIESDEGHLRLRETQAFRGLELWVVALIIMMVLFVTMYGKRVSHAAEREYATLTSFNVALEARVAERTLALAASQAETERQRGELQLRNHHFDIAINNMNRGLCLFDANRCMVVANSRYLTMYGLDPVAHGPGTTLRRILESRVLKGNFSEPTPAAYYAEREAVAASNETAVYIHSMPDGRVIEVGHYPTSDGGFVTTHDDITDRRRMEQQIVHLAYHDALTGLPNRRKLREELDAALKRTERGDTFSALCIDLDHFKQINDTLGHPTGDRLLKLVAERLRGVARKSDLVARLGGDEFAIIQFLSDLPDGATTLANRIIEELSKPYEIDGQQLVIGASVGIAIAPDDGEDANALLKNADLALYCAKVDGKGVYRLFEAEMDALARERRRLEIDLRKAVNLGEFELFYQPIVQTMTEDIVGFEALIRWRHSERGLIPPTEFIPVAEEIGLMGQIGAWVLRQACIEATTWPDHCRVAVNISPAQFRSRQVDLDVLAALSASGLPPKRLELEITESVLMENSDSVMTVLHRLRNFGIKIAMDDFGTGYSSLSYLHTFPFDKIKIDRSFTQSACATSSSMAIVQAVLSLGKNLGMSTTAEGVETAEQFRNLRNEGCVEVQGYLFSCPLPACDVAAYLASDKTLAA